VADGVGAGFRDGKRYVSGVCWVAACGLERCDGRVAQSRDRLGCRLRSAGQDGSHITRLPTARSSETQHRCAMILR
jgi:hypothetical protein